MGEKSGTSCKQHVASSIVREKRAVLKFDSDHLLEFGEIMAGVNEVCEMKPMTNLIKKHVYKLRCPCLEGLSCVSSKGGLVGKLAGKCQQESGEEPAEE
ncbi:unnamed protein product [Larinioides sclopetarius]|uniref:Uncharacterized protein n=1 Tax=Larinioides sclopetarius TaxID=280406 RepID=A0AAV2AW93_9ARAC